MQDCHYYFSQADIDHMIASCWKPTFYIGGMNFFELPIDTTVFRAEAKLRVFDHPSGTMHVKYEPRANKAYTHPLNNVKIESGITLQNMPVQGHQSEMHVLRFFAIASSRPKIHSVPNFGMMIPSCLDVVRDLDFATTTEASYQSIATLTKKTVSEVKEAVFQKENMSISLARWISYFSNRNNDSNWASMFTFVHKNNTQLVVKIVLKVILFLIAPVNTILHGAIPKKYESLDTTLLIRWIKDHVDQLPNSDEKTGKINILSWLMSKFWSYDMVLGRTTTWRDIEEWRAIHRAIFILFYAAIWMYFGNYVLVVIKIVLGTFFSIFFCCQAVNSILCIYLTCAVGLSDAVMVAWRGMRWGVYSISIWIKMAFSVAYWYASPALYTNVLPYTLKFSLETLSWLVIISLLWWKPQEVHTANRFTEVVSDIVRSSKF